MWTRRDKHLPLACDRDHLPLKVNTVDWRLKAETYGIQVPPQCIVDQVPAELIPKNPDVVAILVVNRVVDGHVYLAILSHHRGLCKPREPRYSVNIGNIYRHVRETQYTFGAALGCSFALLQVSLCRLGSCCYFQHCEQQRDIQGEVQFPHLSGRCEQGSGVSGPPLPA